MKRTYSKQLVVPQPEACHHCGSRTIPRVCDRKEGTKVIKEVRWICARCNALFRVGIMQPNEV